MRILIAPNAFKGSLTASQAARAMARGARRTLPGASVDLMPISDGGDGLMEVLLAARGGRRVSLRVLDPLGRPRRAAFALLPGRVAVVEMAQASGLALLGRRRDPLGATSYGTGQLIAAALARGAKTVLVGLGGSATNDGGAGMAQALGARLLDGRGRPLGLGAAALLGLDRIEAPPRLPRGVRVVGVGDVRNPLLGPRGSARVFGPQKGASPAQVRLLERALRRYAEILKRDLGRGVAAVPGAGAAGGLGAGLLGFLGAPIVPGADFVLGELGASGRVRRADLVLTGEGRLDRTSLFGKAPLALARLAKRAGVPCGAVCGGVEPGLERRLGREGLGVLLSLAQAGASAKNTISRAAAWAEKGAALVVRGLANGRRRAPGTREP